MKIFFKILAIVVAILIIAIFIAIKIDYLIISDGDWEKAEDYNITSSSYIKNINEYTKKDVSNKVIFLNFFDTYCGACIKEMPDLNILKKKYENNSDIEFMTFVSKDSITIYNYLKKIKEENNFDSYYNIKGLRTKLKKIYFKTDDIGRDAIPLNMIIDKKGNVAYYKNSMISSEEIPAIVNKIDSLLEL